MSATDRFALGLDFGTELVRALLVDLDGNERGGTSSCHMLMSRAEEMVPGVAGIVRDGILPGLVGYETGQATVADGARTVRPGGRRRGRMTGCARSTGSWRGSAPDSRSDSGGRNGHRQACTGMNRRLP